MEKENMGQPRHEHKNLLCRPLFDTDKSTLMAEQREANREFSMERTPQEHLADIRLTLATMHGQAKRMLVTLKDPDIDKDKVGLAIRWLEAFLEITEGV